MKTLSIAIRLLWKRKVSNAILVFEILVSIIMLAQLYVYVINDIDNLRAIKELPIDNTIVLNTFEYFDATEVMNQIEEDSMVESVDRVYMGNVWCENTSCNLAIYTSGIIRNYLPALKAGAWLDINNSQEKQLKPAVVSAGLGLHVGDITECKFSEKTIEQIYIVGVLQEPTQYLFPSGGASAPQFSAESIIDHTPVVIMRSKDFSDLSSFLPPAELNFPENVFVFLKPDMSNTPLNTLVSAWGKYGEVSRMMSLVENYGKNSRTLINSGVIFFVVFFFLAAFSVLSNCVMQHIYSQKTFAIYYLLGMNHKKAVAIECHRLLFLIVMVLGLCVFAGNYGWLMLEWMTPSRANWFYGIVTMYTVLMLALISGVFIKRLTTASIAESLKSMQQDD